MLLNAIKQNFSELSELLAQLSEMDYSRACPEIGDASVGEHMRHILEMYQCVEKAYISGIVEYDKRERDLALQTRPDFALEVISALSKSLDKPDKSMQLKFEIDGSQMLIPTNYGRELLYNLEHSVHHQALIKVALRHCDATVPEEFGIAKSTIAYRKQCVQ